MPDRDRSMAMSDERAGRLSGKVAIVTGAGSGIGRAAAIRFAQEGARVTLLSRTAEPGEAAAAAAREVAGPGGDARFISTDVTRAEQVTRAIDETLALWGRLDALFNAAGISGRRFGDGPVADCSEEGWRTVI